MKIASFAFYIICYVCLFSNANAVNVKDILKTRENDISFGNSKAKVHIVNYADFGCGHCQHFFLEDFEKINDNYIKKDKVYFTFRPLVISQQSLKMGQYLFCKKRKSDENVKIMKVLFKEIYKLNNPNYIEILEKILKNNNVYENDYYKCVNSKENEGLVLNLRNEAIKDLKITGVPTIFINGNKMPLGDDIFSTIDKYLKAS